MKKEKKLFIKSFDNAVKIIDETNNILNDHINIYKSEEELTTIIKTFLENYNLEMIEVNGNSALIEYLDNETNIKLSKDEFLLGLVSMIILYKPISEEMRINRDNIIDTLLGMVAIENQEEALDFINRFYLVSSQVIVTKAINPELFKRRFNQGETPPSDLIFDLYKNLINIMESESFEIDNIEELSIQKTI